MGNAAIEMSKKPAKKQDSDKVYAHKKGKKKCTYCGKPNHTAEQCRKRIKDEKRKKKVSFAGSEEEDRMVIDEDDVLPCKVAKDIAGGDLGLELAIHENDTEEIEKYFQELATD